MAWRGESWDGEEGYIEGRIRHWVWMQARESHLCEEDREDLAQALRLDLLQRLPSFDPAKAGRRTYVALLIEHRARSLSEEDRAAKRGRQFPHMSLDEPVDPAVEHSMARHELISQDDYLEATRAPTCTQEEHRDLALDLELAEKHLTALEVTICRLLRDLTKKQVADALGIPRTTLQDIVRRIGGKLARAGLKEYCEMPRHLRKHSGT